MAIAATGVGKKVAYKKETTWGTLAGTSSAKYIRRVTSDFNLEKETYGSNELRTDYQVADFRHGIRSAKGNIKGELSPTTYSDFQQSILARDFTTVAAITGLTVSIAAPVAGLQTVTRAAGSWLTDGIEVGNIIRLTGGTLDTGTVGSNLLVVSMSALVLTVRVLNLAVLVTQATIASVTATVQGKKTFAPLTGHTDDSYTIEEFYSDISQSEAYTGMKAASMAVQLPSSGLTTTDISFMGKDQALTGTTQYFTSPTASGTTGIFAAVNGAVVVNGVPVAVITSADFTIERASEGAKVIGQNSLADMFVGKISSSGNMTVYFTNGTFRDYFAQEAEVTIVLALTSDNTKSAAAMSFTFPRVKLGSATRSDSEMGITSQHSFTALLNTVTTNGLPATTVQIQDTTL